MEMYSLITRLIEINIAPLTVLFCNFPLLKDFIYIYIYIFKNHENITKLIFKIQH